MKSNRHKQKHLFNHIQEDTALFDDITIFHDSLLLNTKTYMSDEELEANFAYIEKCYSGQKVN
jgi:hypothetical protein